jgi:hypothetical protein
VGVHLIEPTDAAQHGDLVEPGDDVPLVRVKNLFACQFSSRHSCEPSSGNFKVARGAARGQLLVEHVPGLDRVAHLEADVAGDDAADERAAQVDECRRPRGAAGARSGEGEDVLEVGTGERMPPAARPCVASTS